ncbi:MAG: hypothetical protein J6386_16245 [Candidatus Synoicihabitans palmerolidicus]|nr:hypothetical protein [Candidatus Synoicihabitans palmerolidicus]
MWDAVDLPTDGGGKTKWGARVEAIWAWKNELPAAFPDDIFYGKIPGGLAVLMAMSHLRETHYPAHHRPVFSCNDLAQKVYEIIRNNPSSTAEIRAAAIERHGGTKSRFDTALKQPPGHPQHRPFQRPWHHHRHVAALARMVFRLSLLRPPRSRALFPPRALPSPDRLTG